MIGKYFSHERALTSFGRLPVMFAFVLIVSGLVTMSCQANLPPSESSEQDRQDTSTGTGAGGGNGGTGDAESGYWKTEAHARGEEIYRHNCATCHGHQGEGAEGVFPALNNNSLVTGPYGPLVIVPMYGRGAMPSFSSLLSDEEIALVLTYIRGAWDNGEGAISPSQVAPFRQPDIDVPLDPILGGAA